MIRPAITGSYEALERTRFSSHAVSTLTIILLPARNSCSRALKTADRKIKLIMMNLKHNLYGVYSVFGLIIVLGIALGSDFLMASLTHLNTETFSVTSIILSYILLALLSAATSLLLFWFVLNRASRNIWVALIFLLSGLFIVTYPILYFMPAFGGLFYRLPQLNNILLSFHSYIFSSGSLIAVTGLFTLILPRGNG